MTTHDFTLRILADGDKYIITAECPELAGQAGPVVVKSSDLACMSVIDNDDVVKRMLVDKSLTQRIGRTLYDLIFRETIRDLFNRCTSIADEKTSALRIRLQFQQTPELHVIPWELLHDGNRFLAIDPYRPIVRYLEQPFKEKSMRIESPLRVLFTTACPEGRRNLNLDAEERCVRNALAILGDRVQLTVERRINRSRLRQAFIRAEDRERPFHVWHHCGHGQLVGEGNASSYCLALQETGGSEDLIEVKHVSALIGALPFLRMAILNVCRGASSEGLAPALASINTPCVVGFRTEVLDDTAQAFTKHFYENLPGVPVSVAMNRTRLAMFLESGLPWDWALPVLFMRANDALLLQKMPGEGDDTSSVPVYKPPEALPGGLRVAIKGNSWKVKGKTSIIGATTSDAAHGNSAHSSGQVQIDLPSLETGDLLIAGELNAAPDEAIRRFEEMKKMAQRFTEEQ